MSKLLWDCKRGEDPVYDKFEDLLQGDPVEVVKALSSVYYDRFNNGLCNFDVYANELGTLEVWALENGIKPPVFVTDEDEDGDFEVLSHQEMDTFARAVIEKINA